MKQYNNGLNEVLEDVRKYEEVEFTLNEKQLSKLYDLLLPINPEYKVSLDEYKEYGYPKQYTIALFYKPIYINGKYEGISNELTFEW